jgi:hypothetical protein
MINFRNTPVLVLAALFSSALLAIAGARGGGRGAAGPESAANFLARPDSPEKAPDANGFIQRWLILDPISANGATQNAFQTAAKKEYFPNQLTVIPKDGDKVTVDGAELSWHAIDAKTYNVSLYHFGSMFNKPTTSVLFWVVTVVNCPDEIPNARLAIGSNDASVWWVNGQEVTGIYGDRQTVVDDGVSKRLTLKKGVNVIRAAVHNQAGATDFCARLLDAQDKPITSVSINLAAAGQ